MNVIFISIAESVNCDVGNLIAGIQRHTKDRDVYIATNEKFGTAELMWLQVGI